MQKGNYFLFFAGIISFMQNIDYVSIKEEKGGIAVK